MQAICKDVVSVVVAWLEVEEGSGLVVFGVVQVPLDEKGRTWGATGATNQDLVTPRLLISIGYPDGHFHGAVRLHADISALESSRL